MPKKRPAGGTHTAQRTARRSAAARPKPVTLKQKAAAVFRNSFVRTALVFTLSLFYFEIVFKCSTVKTGFGSNLLLILMFSVSAGCILAAVSSCFPKKVNRIIRIVLLFLLMVPYGVEFFIYREYNIFYDINTITNGAGGAMTDFKDEIGRLVFSFSGISHLLLLALPGALYWIFGKRLKADRQIKLRPFLITAGTALASFLLAVGIIRMSSRYLSFYDKEYSFPSAVSNFGLMTGLRLDISKNTGDQELEFEVVDMQEPELKPDVTAPPAVTQATGTTGMQGDTETTVTTTTTYGKNELDLDFAAMAESDSGTWANLDQYVASLPASSKNEYTGMFAGKNLVLISAEAFTKEAIREDLTPTLYRLYHNGIQLTDYYQPASAGTTGGEFQNVFGLLPMKGGASFPSFSQHDNIALTMAYQLNKQNYWGKAYHNNTYTFYSRHKTHTRLGYSEGYMGYGNGMEKYVKKEWPQSDLDMIAGTMEEYLDQEHFNVYYMSVSGHSGYSRGGNAMSKKNWDAVKDLEYSEPVKAYLAANIELDKALEALVSALEERGIADDTVICLSPDHFPYGLDDNASYGNMQYLSELYGYNVVNTIQRDHNAAILWCGCLEGKDPIVVDAPTSSLDLLPTLSNLFGLEFDSRLMPGRDIFSDAEAIYFDRDYDWKTELGTYLNSEKKFYPKDENTEIPEGYVDRMKKIVRNKISYCQGVINSNYIAHVLPIDS